MQLVDHPNGFLRAYAQWVTINSALAASHDYSVQERNFHTCDTRVRSELFARVCQHEVRFSTRFVYIRISLLLSIAFQQFIFTLWMLALIEHSVMFEPAMCEFIARLPVNS